MVSKQVAVGFLVGFGMCATVGWMGRGGVSSVSHADAHELRSGGHVPDAGLSEFGAHMKSRGADGSHGGATSSDPGTASEEAQGQISQKPGGLYTQDDIALNGSLTPAMKYADVPTRHDLETKKGDRICPITETRANDAFAWWIGGKRYTFCCTPCIDELVERAKKTPEAVKPPESYTKK